MKTMTTPQLIETPASIPGGVNYQHLAYGDAYDAVVNCDYAFVAHKEIERFDPLRQSDGPADKAPAVKFPWSV